MSNVKSTVFDLLKTPQLANLATITLDGKPWTRYAMLSSNDGNTIRCASNIHTRKIKQIEKNPEVHITFGIDNPKDFKKLYLQIQGTAKITTDQKAKSDSWFDVLSAVFSGPEDPNYAVIVIEPYHIELFNPDLMAPEIWDK